MGNEIVVFAGPSLTGIDVKKFKNIEFRAPCKQGDVFLATLDQPKAIAVLDGYFEGQPSVWHKEMLYALSQGIHVYGASSMGALRASEAHTFGMVGVGQIFRAYRDGVYDDDDEVAIVHGPPELDYVSLSEPMVNVRATVSLALEQNILTRETAGLIIRIAKAIYYKNRTWDLIMRSLQKEGSTNLDPVLLKSWLDENAVDQKRIDACELLETLVNEDFSKPFEPDFEFVVTEFWHHSIRTWQTTPRQPEISNHGNSGDGFRLLG